LLERGDSCRLVASEQLGNGAILGRRAGRLGDSRNEVAKPTRRRETERRDPVWEAEAQCERGWRTAGPANDRATRDFELVGELDEVIDPVEVHATRPCVRQAVAGTVDRDEAHAGCLRRVLIGTDQARPRRAVEEDHRPAGEITPLAVGHAAAIAQPDHAVNLR
jgi:hypothetical protein